MTPGGDDHLAPVTPLFGATARGGRVADDGRATGEWAEHDPVADDGWATDDAPGADEAAEFSRENDDESDEAAIDGGEVAASSDAPVRRRATRDNVVIAGTPDSATVSALPTYAAFAATTEGVVPVAPGADERAAGHPSLGRPKTGRFAATGARHDDEDDDATSDEPEETLEAAQHRAENISLHALSRRGVSSHEMLTTLRSRELPDEVVEAEVERLERVGLLNDFELAENLVRSKQDHKGLGKSAITSELRQRGIGQEAIDAAIADIDDDEEQNRADEWAQKRAGQLRGLDQATAERRLNAFLMRRGYRSEVIRRAVERALPRGGSGRGGGVRFE